MHKHNSRIREVFILKNKNTYSQESVGEHIKAERKALKLSQDDFVEKYGKELGISSRTTLYKWEKGEGEPSAWTILKLSNIFGCDPGYLIGEYTCRTRAATDIKAETGLSEMAIKLLSDNPAAGNFLSAVFEDEGIHDLLHEVGEALKLEGMSALRPPITAVDTDVNDYLSEISHDPTLFALGKAVIDRDDAMKYAKLALSQTVQEMLFRIIKRIASDIAKGIEERSYQHAEKT